MLSLAVALLLSQYYPPGTPSSVVGGVDQNGNAHPALLNPGGGLGVSSSAQPTYSTRIPYTNNQGSYTATPFSLVGDAGPAVVVANYTASTVSCYIAQPNGVLGPRTDSVVESAPRAITAADFNGDGITDIALTNRTGLIGVYAGDGGCGFSLFEVLDAGFISAAQGIGSGILGAATNKANSIVVGDRSSWGIDVFINDGGNTGFLAAANYDAGGGGIAQLLVQDINNDGVLDIIAPGNTTVGTISLLEGHSNGTFTPYGTYTTQASAPSSVAIGDFNSDGIPDVALAGGSGGAQRAGIELLLGQVNEINSIGYALNLPSTYYAFASTNSGVCQGIVVGDFNGDGFIDAAASCSSNSGAYSGILIATGDGRGHLSPQPLISTGLGLSPGGTGYHVVGQSTIYMSAADLNGDGFLDLISPIFAGGSGTAAGSGIPNLITWLSQAPLPIAPALGTTWQIAPVPGSMLGASNGPMTNSSFNLSSNYATFIGVLPSRRNITIQTQYTTSPVWCGGGPNTTAYPNEPVSLSDAGFVDGGPFGVPGLEVFPGVVTSIDVNNNVAYAYDAGNSGYASNGVFCILPPGIGAQDGTWDGGWTATPELP